MGKYVGRRHVQDFLLGGSATYGALWLAVKSISAFFVSLKPEGFVWYGEHPALRTTIQAERAAFDLKRALHQLEVLGVGTDHHGESRWPPWCAEAGRRSPAAPGGMNGT